jgi:hypothetical protein
MQTAFATLESALVLGLAALIPWLQPADEQSPWIAILFGGSSWLTGAGIACYLIAVAVVEPFFVGAGFAMYLNRRVELEAWDIEQEFRLAFAR